MNEQTNTPSLSTASPSSLPQLYRPCVGLMLLNTHGDIFVGERIDTPGAWQMPQGGIEGTDNGSESLQHAIFRELWEETGTDKAEICHISQKTFRYDLPLERIPAFWNGRYRGQEQTWVALRFTGDDKDINLNAYETREFMNWKWISPEDALTVIVPFKQQLYKDVFAYFSRAGILV